jgi:hypothetical protein
MRVESGVYPLPPWPALILAAPLSILLALGQRPPGTARTLIEFAALAAMAILAPFAGTEVGFHLSFSAFRNALPWLVVVALWMLVDEPSVKLSNRNRQLLFIATAGAALAGLVQYPHAYGIYFFYVAPLVVLLAGYVAALQQFPPRRALTGLAGFYIAFAVWQLNGPDPHRNVGWRRTPRPMESMQLVRCDVMVPSSDAAVYRTLINIIHQHSATGSYILAGPDCPEVYYLSDRRNPSPVMYEFFRPEWVDDHSRLLELLDQREVAVVVMNCRPSFSPRMPAAWVETIAARFAHQEVISTQPPESKTPVERFRVFLRN